MGEWRHEQGDGFVLTAYDISSRVEEFLAEGTEESFREALALVEETLARNREINQRRALFQKEIPEFERLRRKAAAALASFLKTKADALPADDANAPLAEQLLAEAQELSPAEETRLARDAVRERLERVARFHQGERELADRGLEAAREIFLSLLGRHPQARERFEKADAALARRNALLADAEELLDQRKRKKAQRLFREAETLDREAAAPLAPLRARLENQERAEALEAEARGALDETAAAPLEKALAQAREAASLDPAYAPARELAAELYDKALPILAHRGPLSIQTETRPYRVLPVDEARIGRNTNTYRENLIPLPHPAASRRHGRFFLQEGAWHYQDLPGCTYGTRINGKPVMGSHRAAAGDRFGFWYHGETDPDYLGPEPELTIAARLPGEGVLALDFPDRTIFLLGGPLPLDEIGLEGRLLSTPHGLFLEATDGERRPLRPGMTLETGILLKEDRP